MQRTFITGYTHDVLEQGTYKKLGTLYTDGQKIPAKRARIKALKEAGFPETAVFGQAHIHNKLVELDDEKYLEYGTVIKIDGKDVDLVNWVSADE